MINALRGGARRCPAHRAGHGVRSRRRRADALGRRAARRALRRLPRRAATSASERPRRARGDRRPRRRRLPQRRGLPDARTAASTDALTGLLNHGAIQVRVREEIARAARDGQPLAACSSTSTTSSASTTSTGHLAGDALLRQVAAALRAELRPYDPSSRYGGDEFVLLLPGTDEIAARAVAERVRERLRAGAARTARCPRGAARRHRGLGRRRMDADDLLAQADRGCCSPSAPARAASRSPTLDTDDELDTAAAAADGARRRAGARRRDRGARPLLPGPLGRGRPARHQRRACSWASPPTPSSGSGHAALLHDVGKLAHPERDPRTRTARSTTTSGASWPSTPCSASRSCAASPSSPPLAPIVRHEHEHWDGSGYPDGLAGAQIPLGSRIILACDAYAAMITPRPYRPARSQDEAVAELRAGAGTQFDPDVVDALLDVLGVADPRRPSGGVGVGCRLGSAVSARGRRRDRASRCRSAAPCGTRTGTASRSPDARSARSGVSVSSQSSCRPARRATSCRVPSPSAERRRPRRHGQRDDVALLDRRATGRAGTGRSGRSTA